MPDEVDDQSASNLDPSGNPAVDNPYTSDFNNAYGYTIGSGPDKGQDERDRRYFKKYYDFEVADYVANPTISVLKNENEGDDASTKTTTLAGWYIKISDPNGIRFFDARYIFRDSNSISGLGNTNEMPFSSVDTGSSTTPDVNTDDKGWAGHQNNRKTADVYLNALVEIYRPKKDIVSSEEAGIFYEFSDVIEIENATSGFASHKGDSGYRDHL